MTRVRVRLHLDADTSIRSLHRTLLDRGHDVTRTPAAWMPLDASDEDQLLASAAQGRCLFTLNVRDFMVLAQKHPEHRGILLAAQRSWTLSDLVAALDRFLQEEDAREMMGRGAWLNSWRRK